MNRPPRKLEILSFCYTSISLFGLCLLATLTFNIPISMMAPPLPKQLTGSIFGAICIMGIIVGISPSSCSRIIHFRKRNTSSYKTKPTITETTITFEGHHPTCGNFSVHVIRFGNKRYCAGCAGLVTGATMSLIGSLLYFAGLHVGEAGMLIFWLGFIGVACGLLQYNLSNVNRGPVHFFLNVIFVLGAFLLLVGVNEISGSSFLGVYLLTLIVYWIMARITLSQLEHRKICATCNSKLCSFSLS